MQEIFNCAAMSDEEFGVDWASANDTDGMTSLEKEWLLSELGPRHLPYNSLIPMTVIYTLIFITGMVGNCATCIVIAKNQYMQSATNYYLFNLAIADMLTLTFSKSFTLQYPAN